jgi:hypothetical protein
MSKSEFAINVNTGRLIKKTTGLYRKLKKLNKVKEIEDGEQPKVKEPEVKAVEVVKQEEPFNEHKLQMKLADISTDLIKDNLKQIIKNQKLNDDDFDVLLKKMLFQKLCIADPKQPKQPKEKKKKKSKFKIVEPSSSESESD